MVSVGTIVWLSSELMFFAGLFAMFFSIRATPLGQEMWAEHTPHLNLPYALTFTTILVLSSVTCQIGVFRAERGDAQGVRRWFTITFIMGLIFVIWVGIGPFAGVLALTLHSIASLGKLYSEQVENIDPGPIEALESTGANRLQTIMYGVVPQIIPPYIAFTMYRWDINVRMSTIIGFVGGGGIGFLLQQQLNLLRYRDAGVAVLAIAIVVSVLDYASASIRERYI